MKQRRMTWAIAITMVLGLPSLCSRVIAQQFDQLDSPEWRNALTLYAWLPAQSGDITVRGRTAHVDTTISDAWDALSNLDSAILLYYEGSKGRFTTIADVFYIKLKGGATLGPQGGLNVTFEPRQTIAEIAEAYTVCEKKKGDAVVADTQVLGGLRYAELGLALSASTTNLTFSDSQSRGWVDPFIGARYRQILSQRWGYSVRGDVGGSGIGTGSHFVWNVILDARYSLSRQWALDLGWRWLDYNHGTGSGTDLFQYDVLSNGPFFGFTYGF